MRSVILCTAFLIMCSAPTLTKREKKRKICYFTLLLAVSWIYFGSASSSGCFVMSSFA